jgi:hypothetical protein
MNWPNGMYIAATTESPPGYSIVLRIDVTPPGGLPGYISLDLYRGSLDTDQDPDTVRIADVVQYLGSFRSRKLDPADLEVTCPTVTVTDIEGGSAVMSLTFAGPPAGTPPTGTMYCLATGLESGFPTEETTFQAVFKDGTFHHLWLDVDLAPGYPNPREIGAEAERPSFRDCFKQAGLFLPDPGPAVGVLDERDCWNHGQLLSQTVQREGPQRGLCLRAYLMVASALADSNGVPDDSTVGITFDRQRRAAAVFYGTLSKCFHPGTGSFELDTNVFFTAVHETTHCLNLPHVLEPKHLPGPGGKVLSFMSDPFEYCGNPGTRDTQRFPGGADWDKDQKERYRKFWSAFPYCFRAEELLELRHGARRDVTTSADARADRGDFGGSGSNLALGGPAGEGLELRLRIRGGDRIGGPTVARRGPDEDRRTRSIFEFGEPIPVEAELRFHGKGEKELTRRLSAESGDLEIHYQTPDQRYHTYCPPATICYLPKAKVLNGRNQPNQPASIHKEVFLNLGARSIGFLEPGRYRVRASYRHGDTVLVSNILELYVRYPSPADEDLVVPLLDEDVAAYFAFRGASGLGAARDRLKEAFLDDSDALRNDVRHPLRDYFLAYEGLVRAEDLVADDPLEPADQRLLGRALGLPTLASLDDSKKKQHVELDQLPFSNISLARIALRILAVLQNKPKDERRATALETKLDQALEARGVPARMRKRCLERKL